MIPKFRVWDELLKQMYYPEGFKITFNRGETVISTERELGWVDWEEKHINKDIFLMQSTGLKDKNNVDIYTGDILDIKANFKRLGFVIFDHGKFKVQHAEDTAFYDFTQVLSQCEVIGNIYENKELLEAIK